MKLVYLKGSLEISRQDYQNDDMAMWNVFGFSFLGIQDGSTRTLGTMQKLGARTRIVAAIIGGN